MESAELKEGEREHAARGACCVTAVSNRLNSFALVLRSGPAVFCVFALL